MYDSLLIRSGGGIVKESDLIRTAGNPALIIGLGGLGADALRTLKRKMNVRMVPQREEGFSADINERFSADLPSGPVHLLSIDAYAEWEGAPDFPD
ncbi:MAG: hypothetical protein J6D46_03015, partial [Lachnospiraceae bacterium]|nr:hypothetical protein [Lachnospiraceae bacterium]